MLAAEYIPSLLRSRLMLGRHSGIGNRNPRFPGFGGISRFPIPDRPGIGNRETGRFPIGPREPGIGVPIRRAGDFLVCRGLPVGILIWPLLWTSGPCTTQTVPRAAERHVAAAAACSLLTGSQNVRGNRFWVPPAAAAQHRALHPRTGSEELLTILQAATPTPHPRHLYQ
jgi:hypothetical protein